MEETIFNKDGIRIILTKDNPNHIAIVRNDTTSIIAIASIWDETDEDYFAPLVVAPKHRAEILDTCGGRNFVESIKNEWFEIV